MAKASVDPSATSEPHVLRYHHYSVVQNKERRLAFFTAVNIDGSRSMRLKREPDRWFLDPRIPAGEQTGEPVYERNKLDRGHLVRRLDPAWGDSPAGAKLANDDTFHFTNCTPQHERFNQNKATWAGLEDYLLDNADTIDFKASVFTGPVFAADDEEYRGVQLPRQFWKVAVMVKRSGQLSATAYLLSQESLLQAGLEAAPAAPVEFEYGAYKTFQVPITQVEALTGLSFGALSGFDPLGSSPLESAEAIRPIDSHADLML
jgi:endonuclease G